MHKRHRVETENERRKRAGIDAQTPASKTTQRH